MSNNPYEGFPPPPPPRNSSSKEASAPEESGESSGYPSPFRSPAPSSSNDGAGYGLPPQDRTPPAAPPPGSYQPSGTSSAQGFSSSPYATPGINGAGQQLPPPGYPYPYPPQQPMPGKGLAVASLVLGIVALLFSWIPFLNFFTGIGAVVGLILGIVAIVKASKGTADGKTLAIVGVILTSLALILGTIVNGAVLSEIDRGMAELENEHRVTFTPDSTVTDDAGGEESAPSPGEVETVTVGDHVIADTQVSKSFMDTFEITTRITNEGQDNFVALTATFFKDGSVVGTGSAAANIAPGQTATVDFFSSDAYTDWDSLEYQSNATF